MAALAVFILVVTLNNLPTPKTNVNTYSGSTMSRENILKPTLEEFTLDKESLVKFKIAAVTGNTDLSVELINKDTGEQLNVSGKNLTFADFKKLQPGNYTFLIKALNKASQKIAYSYKLQILTPKNKTQSESSATPKYQEYQEYQTSGLKYNQIIVFNKNPDSGFNWPYLLYIPNKIKKDEVAKILVLPNNTGKPSDNFEDHFNKAIKDFNFLKPHFDNHIILMPVFPRFRNKMGGDLVYTHALDRDSLTILPEDKLAASIEWSGAIMPGDMFFKPDHFFAVQDNLIYRCVAITHPPETKFTNIDNLKFSVIFEGNIDVSRNFNIIEYYNQISLLFKDIQIDNNQLINSTAENDKCFQITELGYKSDRDFKKLWNSNGSMTKIFEKSDIYRLDLQLVKMIEHAQVILQEEENIGIGKKIDMFGFSASASFTDRFVFLHPDLVDKIAIGGFNGILTLPVDKLGEYKLAYPLGIDDYNEITGYAFDLKKVSNIHRFVFMGSEDTNDAALYRDAYSTEEETKIMNLMGKTPIERIPFFQKMYRESGYKNTVFKIYQGVGHTITGEMISDIQKFFN